MFEDAESQCGRMARWASTAVLVGVLLAGSPVAQPAGEAPPPPPPAAEAARAALKRADGLLDRIKGLEGAERSAALERAAVAYREVVEHHATDARACAEAWFELGEISRRQRDLAEAEACYGRAAELDFGRWGERALCQRAHMLRRLDRLEEALATYRKAAEIKPESARAHEARSWIGRCLLLGGEVDGAIEAHRAALEVTEVPRRVIELCNLLAKAQLAKGDLDGAAATLQRADRVVPERAGPEADRLRKAADSMSARRALQRARDKADGAHRDAMDVERSRSGRGDGYLVPTP